MDYKKLNETIEESGMMRSFIAKELGMKPSTFNSRTSGRTAWKVDEMLAFCRVLKLNRAQMNLIFLS